VARRDRGSGRIGKRPAERLCVRRLLARQRAELSFGSAGDGFELVGRKPLFGGVCRHDLGLL